MPFLLMIQIIMIVRYVWFEKINIYIRSRLVMVVEQSSEDLVNDRFISRLVN